MQTTLTPDLSEIKINPALQAMLEAYIDKSVKKQVDEVLQAKIEAQFLQLRQEFKSLMPKTQGLEEMSSDSKPQSVTIILSSNDFDRVLPAYIIATGAASFGMKVTIFATLWGLTTLRKKTTYSKKKITEKMITMMTPSIGNLGLSKMHMMGVGASMMKGMLKSNNVSSLPELIETAAELGVNVMACQMTMGVMGVTCEELRDDVTYGGVAAYIEKASESTINLFI